MPPDNNLYRDKSVDWYLVWRVIPRLLSTPATAGGLLPLPKRKRLSVATVPKGTNWNSEGIPKAFEGTLHIVGELRDIGKLG